jgi:hypothetical protein
VRGYAVVAMLSPDPPRVQFVISSRFVALFLVALSLLGGGYYWYGQQQDAQERLRQTQERFKAPPYFINRGATIQRSCGRCLDLGKLKPQPEWKIGPPTEIPATELRWFLAVEDPPIPVTVSGVLMLPVHPAFQDNPSFGFDQTRVMLVLYQSLQRMPGIEQLQQPSSDSTSQTPQPVSPPTEPALPPEAPAEAASSDSTAPAPTIAPWQLAYLGDWKNVYSDTTSLTRLLITSEDDKLLVHAWHSCFPELCDWGTVTADAQPASRHLRIVWNQSNANHQQDVSLESGGRLRVTLKTHRFSQMDTEVVLYFSRAVNP